MLSWLKQWWIRVRSPYSVGLLTYQMASAELHGSCLREFAEDAMLSIDEFKWTGTKWEYRRRLFVRKYELPHYSTFTPERLPYPQFALPPDSPEIVEAVRLEVERLNRKQRRRYYLSQARHFHSFGFNRVCVHCGLSRRDYDMMKPEDAGICPKYTGEGEYVHQIDE